MAGDPVRIQIYGLTEFRRELRALDRGLPKALRIAMNEAADVVVSDARPKVPRRTGKAAASIRAQSTQTSVRVAAGGNRAPWYPWLDWGGRVGRRKAVKRAFFKEGRYLYPAYYRARDSGRLQEILGKALRDVADSAGIRVG